MRVICNKCGAVCETRIPAHIVDKFLENDMEFPWLCSTCFEARRQEEEEAEAREIEKEEAEWLDTLVAQAGVRPEYAVRKPYVPYVADWLHKHRTENVLLSGETGTGKSTSAGFVIRSLLKANATVHVYYMAELLDRWREVRCTNDNPNSIRALFAEIESNDFLIIDECAGKTVNSDSTREFMFRLLEDVASGACHAVVWLLGNFYTGSVAATFGDEAPAMRRIQENFVCGRISAADGKVIPIFRR